MPTKLRLDFKNLPLAEAAVRVSFETPVSLTISQLTRLHKALQQDFPRIAEPRNLETPPGVSSEISLSPGQLLGAMFQGNPNGLVISLQSQVVVVRWLRGVEPNSPEYPRFPEMRQTLFRTVEELKSSLDEKLPAIVVTNMSYVNFLEIGHDEPILGQYFSSLVQIDLVQSAKRVRKLEVSLQQPNDVDLRMRLEQSRSGPPGQEEVQGFQLTTAAGVRLQAGGSREAREGLDLVHAQLQDFFVSLISERAKNEWQLEVHND